MLTQGDSEIAAHLAASGIVDASTTGVKRDTTYGYPASFSGGALKEGVLLEMGSRGGAHTASLPPFRSMVAIYADEVLGERASVWEEFAAVHPAASADDADEILKAGRHFFDIARLLDAPLVTDALDELGPEGVRKLAADIDRHSETAGFPWSPGPVSGFADSPAFNADAVAFPHIVRGYESALGLVYGRRPPLTEVFDVVHQNRHRL